MSSETAQLLEHHWALDSHYAEDMAARIPPGGDQHIADIVATLDPGAVKTRDAHRTELKNIIHFTSPKMTATLGPCSTDREVNYDSLHDLRNELQEAHPDWFVDERLNGDKPRSNLGWRGMLNSTDPEDRRTAFRIMHEAFQRGIPIQSEITDPTHLGSVAPYSTGVWIGARDVGSSLLRGALSAVSGMPVAVKNGTDGNIKTVENALVTIGGSIRDNDGSGINLGTIASTADHLGFPTGFIPVERGNPHVAIIGRGYELPKSMSRSECEAAAFLHISELCGLAALRGTIVKLDLNHASPKMFRVDETEVDRPLRVVQRIAQGIEDGRITNPERIRGFMCEIGPVKGRTDPNWLISHNTAEQLGEMMLMLTRALRVAV